MIALFAIAIVSGVPYDPTSDYDEVDVRGWRVLVSRRLSWDEPKLCGDVMGLLDRQLGQVEGVLPTSRLEQLRGVTIWVERDEPHHPCMAYHPDAGWLRDHGMNPEKARGVEIADARNFLDWVRIQPWMVFHELAHAYHDRVLGFDDREIRAAFERARDSGSYEHVRHADGGEPRRHYAMTNPMEYFAELSESRFGRNDFYPFDREELREHDPEGLEAIDRAWGR